MAILDHNGESEFPFQKEKVFEAMCFSIPTIKGMKIEYADKLQGRIMVKAGISLFSWGENIPIQLIEVSENKTKVQITSSPKTGMMFGGAFDMGKNRKNIEEILLATSRILSSQINPIQQSSTVNNPDKIMATSNFETLQNKNSTKWYQKTWLVIILCIIVFPVGLYALWKNSTIKLGWKIVITAIIALIIIANIGGSDNKPDTPVNKKSEVSSNNSVKEEPKSNWAYTQDIDKMTNDKRYFASCISTNEIEFDFPYNGGSSFTLIVRQMGKGNEIVLKVSKGQFMSSIGSSEYIRAKFDNEQPLSFSYNSAADGSDNIIFLDNSDKFLLKLKNSKKILLEAPFFSAGRQHIEFNVDGLKWNK